MAVYVVQTAEQAKDGTLVSIHNVSEQFVNVIIHKLEGGRCSAM